MSGTAQRVEDVFDTDVIVVGAGPVGLTLGCALRHHGVEFRIFEERTKPKPYSRANNVWARPQELLDSIGVRAALAEKSYRIEKQTQFLNGHVLDQVELDTHAAYGLDGTPALVLVRPDGHIAFRGPARRPDLLEAYCSKVFGAPSR